MMSQISGGSTRRHAVQLSSMAFRLCHHCLLSNNLSNEVCLLSCGDSERNPREGPSSVFDTLFAEDSLGLTPAQHNSLPRRVLHNHDSLVFVSNTRTAPSSVMKPAVLSRGYACLACVVVGCTVAAIALPWPAATQHVGRDSIARLPLDSRRHVLSVSSRVAPRAGTGPTDGSSSLLPATSSATPALRSLAASTALWERTDSPITGTTVVVAKQSAAMPTPVNALRGSSGGRPGVPAAAARAENTADAALQAWLSSVGAAGDGSGRGSVGSGTASSRLNVPDEQKSTPEAARVHWLGPIFGYARAAFNFICCCDVAGSRLHTNAWDTVAARLCRSGVSPETSTAIATVRGLAAAGVAVTVAHHGARISPESFMALPSVVREELSVTLRAARLRDADADRVVVCQSSPLLWNPSADAPVGLGDRCPPDGAAYLIGRLTDMAVRECCARCAHVVATGCSATDCGYSAGVVPYGGEFALRCVFTLLPTVAGVVVARCLPQAMNEGHAQDWLPGLLAMDELWVPSLYVTRRLAELLDAFFLLLRSQC